MGLEVVRTRVAYFLPERHRLVTRRLRGLRARHGIEENANIDIISGAYRRRGGPDIQASTIHSEGGVLVVDGDAILDS
jgi:hypothetical protein